MARTTARQVLTRASLHKSVWGKRIIAAERRGHFSATDSRLSGSWTTCACSRHDPALHYWEDPACAPWDGELGHLGLNFARLVDSSSTDFVAAARVLVKVERRAAVLLRGLFRKDKMKVKRKGQRHEYARRSGS